MKKLQKPISVLTSFATVLMLSGMASIMPMSAIAATIVDGDLIRNTNADSPADQDIYIVKMIGEKKFKRLILNPQVFESYGHLDKNGDGDKGWNDVMDVDQATMDMYITSDLVRVVGTDQVYRLYAADGTDAGDKFWLNMDAAAFDGVFDSQSIYEINSTDSGGYTVGANVVDPSADFPPAGTGDPVSTGTLTCSLASDTPVAGYAVARAARLPFTKVNCSAVGGDVVIDSLVVERTGLAQDDSISSIDVIDAGSNLPVNVTSKTLNSEHKSTFNDDITVSNGSTKSLVIAANMATTLTAYAGEGPSLSLASLTLKGNASSNTLFPLVGTMQTINSTISIGTVAVDSGTYSNATNTTIQVGKTDYTFLAFQVQAGSVEKVSFSQIKVYQQGSASLGTDLINLRLFRDGTELDECDIISSKYATCSFATIVLDKGGIGQFKLIADVDDGSGRTVTLGIYKATDLLVTGETYGYNITPTFSEGGTAAGGGSPVFNDADFTISNGTVNVSRSNQVGSENIAIDNNQVLGSFEFEVKGETIDISALTLTVATTTATGSSPPTGFELVDPDGNAVAGPTDKTNGAATVAWTDTFTLPVGKSIYTVRADMPTNSNWASNDTIAVNFTPSAMTATGNVTGNAITATPSSAVAGNTQTVKGASLVVTRRSTPSNKTIVVGQKDLTLASWDFDASASGEDIRITTLGFTAAAATMAATNTAALTVYVDDVAQSPVNDAIATNVSVAVSSTFAFDEAIVILKGTKAKVELKGDKTTVASNDTEQWGMLGNTITATSVQTGQAVTESITADAGPVITSRAMGMMTVDVDSKPSSGILVHDKTAGAASIEHTFVGVGFTALYEAMRLDQLIVNIGDGGYEFSSTTNYADVREVCLYEGADYITGSASGSCSSIPSTGTRTFDFSSDVLTIPQNNQSIITIKASMPMITSSINAPSYSSADIKLGFGGTDGIKFTGMSSNAAITGAGNEVYNDSTSSYQVLYKSKPTVTIATSADSLGADTTLTDGIRAIFAYKVSADSDGGDVLLYRNTFAFTTSTGSNIKLTNCYLKYSGDNYAAKIKANATPAELNVTVGVNISWLTATFNNPEFDVSDASATDEAIKITSGNSATFRLYCSVSGAGTAGENISTFLVGDTASTSANVGYNNCAHQKGTTSSCTRGFATSTTDFSNGDQANFLWSDNWLDRRLSSSGPTGATSSAMWYNGYLVPGLEKSVTTTSYTLSY